MTTKSKKKIKTKNLLDSWRKVKLGEVLELKYGFGLPEKKRRNGEVLVFGSSGIVGTHNKPAINSSGIIVGRKGHVGSVYYSKKPFYPIDTVYYVDQLKISGDLKFFYYFLQRMPLQKIGSDVGVPGLNRDIAYGLEVVIPEDPADQKRIADILSAFDDKIELNNKISRTLEQMAQAIFKEWFVNFKFPGHKKVKMVDSELGKIPEGWEVISVEQLVKRLPQGKTYRPEELKQKGSVPVYDQSSGIILGYHDGEPAFSATIDAPVIVFGDHTCRMKLIIHPCSLGPNVVPFIGKSYPTAFIYYLTKERIVQHEYKRHWTEFEQQEFLVPPLELAKEFAKLMRPLVQKMVEAENENQKLGALRDLLLQKLMSGEIEV